MKKRMSRPLLSLAVSGLVIPLYVHAADLVNLKVNVQQEKHNVVVHFKKAAIGQVAVPSDADMNAFIGVTDDLGGPLPVYVLLKEGMPLETAAKYAEHQGKNHGEAKCELVQKGNSPQIPSIPLAVLAQNCTILSVAF